MKRRPKKPRARCLSESFVYVRSDQQGDGYLAKKFAPLIEAQRAERARADAERARINKEAADKIAAIPKLRRTGT